MNTTPDSDIISEIRSHTSPMHDRIEQLPVALAMMQGRIDRASYVQLLGRLFWVHSIFERQIEGRPELASAWPKEAIRADAIARDLKALGAGLGSEAPESVVRWRDDLEKWAANTPTTWLGAGYVLEGSRLGGQFLLAPLAKGLGLSEDQGVGLDYHREGVEKIGERWRRVRESLLALDCSSETRASIVHAAVATFDLLFDLHRGIELGPLPEHLDQNPRATAHPN